MSLTRIDLSQAKLRLPSWDSNVSLPMARNKTRRANTILDSPFWILPLFRDKPLDQQVWVPRCIRRHGWHLGSCHHHVDSLVPLGQSAPNQDLAVAYHVAGALGGRSRGWRMRARGNLYNIV